MYSSRIYICLFFSLTPLCVSDPTESEEPKCIKGDNPEQEFVIDYTKSLYDIRRMEGKLDAESPAIDYLCQRALDTDNDGVTSFKYYVGEQTIKSQYLKGNLTVVPIFCRDPDTQFEAYFCLSARNDRIFKLAFDDPEYIFQETVCITPVLE